MTRKITPPLATIFQAGLLGNGERETCIAAVQTNVERCVYGKVSMRHLSCRACCTVCSCHRWVFTAEFVAFVPVLYLPNWSQGFAFAKEWCSKGNGPIYIEVDTYR